MPIATLFPRTRLLPKHHALARSAALALLLALPLVATAEDAPAKTPDCEDAKKLPADADEESRRLACEIPAEFREDVYFAEFFGGQMRRHDIAAWVTTDALRDIGAFEGVEGAGRGWLTRDADDRIEVRYFRERDFIVDAFAQADLDLATVKAVRARRLQPTQLPTADEQALLRASALAMARDGLRCSDQVNTIIFPFTRENRREIRVYVMSAWNGGDFVFGGHQQVTVSGDGEAVTGGYEHTRACLPIAPQGKSIPGGATHVATMVSHLTSPTPNEFHVFLSLQHRMPIYVSTAANKLLWKVDGVRITLESGIDDKEASAP